MSATLSRPIGAVSCRDGGDATRFGNEDIPCGAACVQCISEFISDFGPSNQRLGRSIFFGPPLGADEAKEVREKIHLSLARQEGYAEGGVWNAGPDLTAADIVAYPGLKLLLRASRRPEATPLELRLDDFETRFPGVAAWMQRIEQLPGYEKTYPPHWRQA